MSDAWVCLTCENLAETGKVSSCSIFAQTLLLLLCTSEDQTAIEVDTQQEIHNQHSEISTSNWSTLEMWFCADQTPVGRVTVPVWLSGVPCSTPGWAWHSLSSEDYENLDLVLSDSVECCPSNRCEKCYFPFPVNCAFSVSNEMFTNTELRPDWLLDIVWFPTTSLTTSACIIKWTKGFLLESSSCSRYLCRTQFHGKELIPGTRAVRESSKHWQTCQFLFRFYLPGCASQTCLVVCT